MLRNNVGGRQHQLKFARAINDGAADLIGEDIELFAGGGDLLLLDRKEKELFFLVVARRKVLSAGLGADRRRKKKYGIKPGKRYIEVDYPINWIPMGRIENLLNSS